MCPREVKNKMGEEEGLMPYQQEFSDGFIINRLLKKAKTRGGLIYTALDGESYSIGGDVFLPTWDSTDHFHFVCKKCKAVADVLAVKFNTRYGGGVKHALFFYLGCRKCGATGQRKIYLDRRVDACLFQHACDKGNVYIYGKKEEPERTVTREEMLESYLKQKTENP